MSPQRIQLSRKKGWRKPEGAVVVARPTKWGNPHRVGTLVHCGSGDREWTYKMTAADAVSFFEADLRADRSYIAEQARAELAGKDLACWCPLDRECHADVLLDIANPGSQTTEGAAW